MRLKSIENAVFLLVVVICHHELSANEIVATGGGILKEGEDLVLTFKVTTTSTCCKSKF